MNFEQIMTNAGYILPKAPEKGGLYTPAQQFNKNLVYVSGCGPVISEIKIKGTLGAEFTSAQGQEYAKNCMLNVLSTLKATIGSLNRIKRCVKITVFIASANSFYEQPQVANGASRVLLDIFGDSNLPSRSAIGVNVLPGNIPVEVEALFEIEV